jgi:tripartite-type tricarboxylate transporter receptor subunit TctC
LVAAPDIPRAAESGFPGLTVRGWIGLAVPAGISSTIADNVVQAARAAVAERPFQQMLIEAGIEPALDSSPEHFRRVLAADVAQWAPIVKSLNLKID